MSKKKDIIVRVIALADQLCFSVANFILSIILARFYSEVELAAFIFGLSVALTIQGIQRNCYVVQNAVLAPEILRRRADKVIGQQAVAWLILVTIEILAAVLIFNFVDDVFYHYVAISTIVCTIMNTQLEFDRIIFVKHNKYIHAALTSIGFLALTAGLLLAFAGTIDFIELKQSEEVIKSNFNLSFYGFMGLIGGFMVLKMLFMFSCSRLPNLYWGFRLLVRDFKRYFMGSVFGVAGYAGHNHVPVFVLGAYAAPIHAAVYGAMRGLMQPLQIIVRSLDIIDKNLFQAKVKNAGGMRSVLIRQLLIYSAMSAMVVVGTLLFGKWIVNLAYGEKYAAYSHILVGWALIFSMLAITFPLETVIVKLNKLNLYNYCRIAAGVVGTVLSFALWEEYGAMGGVAASLAGWVVSIICAFWIVMPVLKKGGAHG